MATKTLFQMNPKQILEAQACERTQYCHKEDQLNAILCFTQTDFWPALSQETLHYKPCMLLIYQQNYRL